MEEEREEDKLDFDLEIKLLILVAERIVFGDVEPVLGGQGDLRN
jgi:hypothetical protein